MPHYVIPGIVEIDVEADNIEAALEGYYSWRKHMMEAVKGRLEEIGVDRVSISTVREVMEVDEAWLENRKQPAHSRRKWDYQVRKVPMPHGPKMELTLRTATGPKNE